MKSISAPTVILPKYLQGTDPESTLFAETYFMEEVFKWLTDYRNKIVEKRKRYYTKNPEVKEPES